MICSAKRPFGRVLAATAAAAAVATSAAPAVAQCQEPTQVISPDKAHGVAISGDLMVVRGVHPDGSPVLRTFRPGGGEWVERDAFDLSTRGALALSGDRVIIGRIERDPVHITVLRRSGESWAVEAELTPDTAGGRFGADVAIDQARAIVGQPAPGGGQAHLYRRVGDRWVRDGSLAPPSPDLREFGAHVTVDGNVAAVSAMRPDDDGVICVYRRRGEWRLEDQIIVPLDEDLTSDVDLDGNRLIASVGNPARPAHIYARRGGAWSLEARLSGGGRWSGRWADAHVELSGDRALVVRISHDHSVGMGGVGYVYVRDGKEWKKDRTLIHADLTSVVFTDAAIDGETAALLASGRARGYDLARAPTSCPAPRPDLTSGMQIKADGMLTPQTPSTTVVVEAFAHHSTGGFAGAHFDAVASEAGWKEPRLTSTSIGISRVAPGIVEGPLVRDVLAGQRVRGYGHGPVEIWKAEFEVTDFTPRRISLGATIYHFGVYRMPIPIPWRFHWTGVVDPAATVRVWRSDCLADCDGSGEVDLFDFLCFQELFGAGNMACDLDEDGGLTIFDFLVFQNEFGAGCP